jgi:hypothetical protein
MRRDRGVGVTLACAMLALAFGCTDPTGAPGDNLVPAPSESLLSALLGGDTVVVVQRFVSLAEDEVVTTTVGPLGGRISLPNAGLTLVVPPGAVTAPTSITVSAPAGNLLGYSFHPHGLTFNVPLLASQDLSGTNAFAGLGAMSPNLVAAYFEGSLTPSVEALEILPLGLSGRLGLFNIQHFSGYIVGTN